MRSDLGRLGASAEILQVGPSLARKTAMLETGMLGGTIRPMVYANENAGSIRMRILGAAAVIALLAGPAYAQVPNVNLIPELKSKTPEEKEQEAEQQKAYKESLRKIPDAKASSDPWGMVRSADTPKAAAPAKPKKTGSTAN
jgi:hypothetical protein